jgi:YihY family inner membrane protein
VRTNLRGGIRFARQLLATASESQLGFLAAAIAYYAFVSFLPFVLLSLSVASIVGGEAFSAEVVSLLSEFLTPEARELVADALTLDAAAGGATVVGLLALTWSSLRLFRGLDTAFATVYGTTGDLTLLDRIRDGLIVLVAIVVGVFAIGVAGEAVRRVASPLVPGVAGGLLLVTITVALLPLFYVFPNTDVSLRGVLPGTTLAAVGWAVLGGAFQAYASIASTSVYGVLGGALLVVTWLYFGAMVVLVGAVLNATLAGYAPTEDRKGQHPGLRQTSTTAMAEGDDDGPAEFDADSRGFDPEEAEAVRTELDRVWEELDDVEDRLDEKTISRSEFEAEMKRYVRKRQRRGHARGWGPYLVLLYGTAMTLGAFFYLEGVWAVLAMFVIWLSTLGLYVVMAALGAIGGGLSMVGRIRDALGSLRS